MKDLSIVIVNYNVKHFLKGCLESIYNADWKNLDIEIWVVDNASVDGSVEMVKKDFPQVQLISSAENLGFSKGNNLALRQCKSKYRLLLNPDTIVEENTFTICYEYMENHAKVGALGVKMIDGTGRFLPESKRALPSLWNSFTKLSGLASLFPKSKTFNHYALGHLSENETQDIEVLCGAFMFMRGEALSKVGLLDEAFFMYGEDIDLSYRFLKEKYKIHYLPKTKIIHYKGESTKKASFNYVKTFYGAMSIYVRKHYQGFVGGLLAQLIQFAIIIRAFLSLLSRWTKSLFPALLDGILIFGGLYLFSKWWGNFQFSDKGYFDYPQHYQNIGIYASIWALVLTFIGYYKRVTWRKRIQGILGGLGIALLFYALLPESLRTSRTILLSGTLVGFLVTTLTGLFWNKDKQKSQKTLVVATIPNAEKILTELDNHKINYELHGIVSPHQNAIGEYINNINALEELVNVLNIDEVIFDSQDIQMKDIMDKMIALGASVSFKIAGDDKLSLLGSNSKNKAGELYSVDIRYNLTEAYYRHLKRSFDLLAALFCLVFSPILIGVNKFKIGAYFKNTFSVLLGYKTMVGYSKIDKNLPVIRTGIIPALESDIHYAKSYNVWMDVEAFVKQINKIASYGNH